MNDARLFAEQLAAKIGGDVRRAGREWRCCCPVHEADRQRHNPSFALWSRPDGSLAFTCMGGCKHGAVVAELKRLGFEGFSTATPEQLAERRASSEAHRISGMLAAREIYATAHPIEPNGPVDRYLTGRRLVLDQYERRFLMEAPNPDVRGGKLFVALIVDLTTIFDQTIKLCGVQTLPVDAGGRAAIGRNGKKWRQITGMLKGCGVPIGRPGTDGRVVVGEGIETVLAAKRLLHTGFGVASLSGSNMPAVELPRGIVHIMITADNDVAGAQAASDSMARWRKFYQVRSVVWGERGDDAASEWVKREQQGA